MSVIDIKRARQVVTWRARLIWFGRRQLFTRDGNYFPETLIIFLPQIYGSSAGSVAFGHLPDEGEEGEVHGYDDGADGDAEEADHDRLEERQEARDCRVDLLLVEVRYLAEHRVERARLLAYPDHLRDHVGEYVGRLQRLHHLLSRSFPAPALVVRA